MDRPRIYVDFNEMLDRDVVLLSKEDSKIDSDGKTITFSEGMEVFIYQEDYSFTDDTPPVSVRQDLRATGVATRTENFVEPGSRWPVGVKWCCRFDEDSFHFAEIGEDE